MSVRESRRRPLWMVAGALILGLTLVLVGCSSSGGGSSSTTTSGGGSASTTTGAAGSSTSTGGLAAAEAALKPFLQLPSAIPVTTPLKSKPASGKTIVWTNCDAQQCATAAKFLKQATDAVGWNLKLINYKTEDPSTLVTAMTQALLFHPVATMLVALPQAVWGSVIPAYEKAGVAIVPWSTGPVTVNSTVLTQLPNVSVATTWGQILANNFIVDSQGKGEAVLYTVPTFAVVTAVTTGFQAAVKANCPGCTVHLVSQSYADIAAGKANGVVVSAFQRYRSSKYLVSGEIVLNQGISSALTAAGITGIKISGNSADTADEALVKSGVYQAVMPNGSNIFAWLMVDAALRKSEGMPAVEVNAVNNYLYTKATPLVPSDSFNAPTDWQEQFKKLWQVG